MDPDTTVAFISITVGGFLALDQPTSVRGRLRALAFAALPTAYGLAKLLEDADLSSI